MAGAAAALGCPAPHGFELSGDFPLGVASGDVTDSAALIWTLYRGALPLELSVWTEDGTERFRGVVAPSADGFVHAEATGLPAGARLRYAFFELAEGARRLASAEGRLRTAVPEDSLEPMRVGATCCTKLGVSMRSLEQAARREDLDLFLHLGDAVYADGAQTLEQYRSSWAATLNEAGPRSLRAAHAQLVTWDDHEFANNWSGETLPAEVFATASRAFFEHQPVRRHPAAPSRIWRRLRWGRTAEFFVLDGRGERKPSTRHRPDAQYLSPEQLGWLKQGLSSSPARFKVILNSVPIGQFRGLLYTPFDSDRWEGYAAQRHDLLRHIDEEQIPGVLWVSGDFHLASIGRVSRSAPGHRALEVLVGPGGNNPNPSPAYPSGSQFDFAYGRRNYTTLALRPQTGEVEISYHGEDDELVTRRSYFL